MLALPIGTVTFLFTDIEGSTRLVQHLGDARSEQVFADHRRLLRDSVEAAGGFVAEDQGESFLFVFPRARDAVLAAVAAQRALAAHRWPEGVTVRVRMGLHTGEPAGTGEGYVGVDVHRVARICQAGHGGQILLSQTTRELVEEDLPDGVSLRGLGEHRLKDLVRPQRLFQAIIPDILIDFPPLKSLEVLPNNLPIQLTSFIGREREIAEVKRLLSTTRLLTLTGTGGVGKTRLGLQVAAQALDDYKDGVWLVELAPLADPALVPPTVAAALGAREQPGRPIMATLVDFLQPKQILLVLDNAEHLVETCAQLADVILRACPNVRVLATSREGLAIAGETSWRVPPLSLPDLHRLPPVDRLMGFEAIRLFVERAKAVLPSFKLTTQNALVMARICHQLDGLPLAIELAAARVNLLSGEQIAARLDDRFRLLTGGGRTTLPRQQTLRAVIDWSHDLLSAKEQTLLRRLSVFAGGWTLEAADAVCSGEGLDGSEVLDLLTHLANKSLLVTEVQDEARRYQLLETVRQYGRKKLHESGEESGVRKQHLEWYLGLAERAERELDGPNQVMWLDRLETEHENLRVALEWCHAADNDPQAGLRLAGALRRFWRLHGHWNEGRQQLAAVLSRGKPAGHTGAMAKGLHAAGQLAFDQSDMVAARLHYEEAREIFKELGDEMGVAWSLHGLGDVAHCQDDQISARSFYEESLALWLRLGERSSVAEVLRDLGELAGIRGDIVSGRSLLEESLAMQRETGHLWGIARSLHDLGELARLQGDYGQAAALYEESLALVLKLGDRGEIASIRHNLGHVAQHQGDYRQAEALFKESLVMSGELANGAGVGQCIAGLAGLAGTEGRRERAVRLFAAAAGLLDALGFVMDPADRADYDANLATMRAALSEEAFATAWAEGLAMTLEQATAYALEENPALS